MRFSSPVVQRVNSCVIAARSSARLGPFVRKYFTIVTYVGRRSGRTFSTPVGYRRKGDVVTITVMFADAKTWWRNFTGDGGPLSLELDGTDRTGHAVARRLPNGRAEVVVTLG